MPVTKGTYASVETYVYSFCKNTLGFNTAVCCGILANIQAESTFNPKAVGDGGNAYGLCQWNSRRKTLIDYCKKNNLNYTSKEGQMAFMKHELFEDSYEGRVTPTLQKLPNTAQGAYDAAYQFCVQFERPSSSESKGKSRGATARDTFWKFYSNGANTTAPTTPAINRGQAVVEEAKKYLGGKYVLGGKSPSTGFDCSGYTWYCYKYGANYDWDYRTAAAQKNYCKKNGRAVSKDSLAAGDLVFFYSADKGYTSHVAIATGNGKEIINAQNPEDGIKYSNLSGWSEPYFEVAYRLFSDSETIVPPTPGSSGGSTGSGTGYREIVSFDVADPYTSQIAQNLSRIEAEGYDYGYLIDMTHGGMFKFYIPEFSETAGANYSNVSIIGRSVEIKAYDSTSARAVTVSLDLYASAGLYNDEQDEDIVGKLHDDLNFIRSLEYPDYSHAIIQPPAVVHLILGAALDIEGVVSGVNIQHLKPLDQYNRSMYAKVSFTVTQVAPNPPDYSDVLDGVTAITSSGNRTTMEAVGDYLLPATSKSLQDRENMRNQSQTSTTTATWSPGIT